MSVYAASGEVLVYLINQTVNGSDEKRVAANFILYCLRVHRTKQEIAHCIDDLEERAILDVARNARSMALSLGLIA